MEDVYFKENLTDKEREIIKPYFSSVEKNVFVLTNLPEVIKGTLFSRYSRSDKGARRLLLDEFIPNKDVAEAMGAGAASNHANSALAINRAEDFYQRILVGYGDDSVAELAGVHVACENISSLAGDMLTDSRLGISPLEKSARYILFDKMVDGRYLWYRDPKIMNSKHAKVYEETMDLVFSSYAKWLPVVMAYVRKVSPKDPTATDRAYESATRAKACDILKNLLPAGRLTNVGLYGNGRAFEYLLTKLYSSSLEEARQLAKDIHEEMAKVIPSFVKRAQPSEYLIGVREGMQPYSKKFGKMGSPEGPYLKLVDFDTDGEAKVLAAMIYPYSNMQLGELVSLVKKMTAEEKKKLVADYLSKRRNRRDKPGRALENLYYTFELCANYGMFRDLHRHRVLSQEKQPLSTSHGFDTPWELAEAGIEKEYNEVMMKAAEAFEQISKDFPSEAQYIVPRGFRMRWYMKLNLREVHHLTELRSSKQGHPDYRKMAQNMRNLVAEKHPTLVAYMQVDMNEYALPRIESEKRIDRKLAELDKKAEAK
ncbi:MAG TPA: FAD-dependent thymidylate synthase [Candidatus Saccharimonadales bacterium]|nr:FAD-dependent thymidylate synthase [Candidatus Saccharimonadales bacterium]